MVKHKPVGKSLRRVPLFVSFITRNEEGVDIER